MDCKRDFTVIQIERLLLPVKWKKKMDYLIIKRLLNLYRKLVRPSLCELVPNISRYKFNNLSLNYIN